MSIMAGKVIVGVLGLGAASVLGFNWITTGCPTGVCPTERAAQAAITQASLPAETEASDACCALMAEADVQNVAAKTESCATDADACAATAAGCCNADKTDAVMTNVAATTEATDSCCAEKAAAEPVITNVAAPAAKEGECCFDKGLPEPCSTEKACCQENYNLADQPAAEKPVAANP
jgi:hypothetical protein